MNNSIRWLINNPSVPFSTQQAVTRKVTLASVKAVGTCVNNGGITKGKAAINNSPT